MTVREKIDQLAAEPPVRDLGYVADQRLVASALLGLQLLADEIDALKAGGTAPRRDVPFAGPYAATVTGNPDVAGGPDVAGTPDVADGAVAADAAVLADIVTQLGELSAQMVKLTAAVKASAELPQLAYLSDQIADLTAAVKGTPAGDDESPEQTDRDQTDAEQTEPKKNKKNKKKKKKKDKDKKREKKILTLE